MQEKFLKFARYPKCFGYVFTIIMLILSITTFIFLAPWNHRIDTSGWEKVNTPVNIRILNSEKSYSFFNRIEVGFFNRRHRTSPSSPTSSIVYKTTFHFESIPDVIKFSAEQETGAHDYQNPQSGNMEEIKGKQDGRITYTGICFSDSPILTGDIQVERSLVNKNIYRLCGTRISRIMTSSYTSGMFVCICMFCMTIGGLFIIYKQAHKTVKNSNGKLNKLAVISKFSSNHCYYLWHYFILMLIIAGFLYWEIKVVSCLFILKGDGTISFFLLELCVCSFLSIIGVVIFYRFLKDWGKNGILKWSQESEQNQRGEQGG